MFNRNITQLLRFTSTESATECMCIDAHIEAITEKFMGNIMLMDQTFDSDLLLVLVNVHQHHCKTSI